MSEHDEVAFRTWRGLFEATMRVGRIVRGAFQEHGLTGAQFGAFRVIGEAEPAGIKLSDIGGKLFVTCGNITGLVDRLEEARLVIRVSHPDDRRALLAKLTPRGQELFDKIVPAHRARISRIMSCLSSEEQKTLAELLGRVAESADRYAAEASDATKPDQG